MESTNTVPPRPQFARHRLVTGAPVVADAAAGSLSTALALKCRGWKSIVGFVKLAGGAGPTVTLQLLRVIKYTNSLGVETELYVDGGLTTAALSDEGFFTANVVDDQIFLRISAVTGNPTSVDIHVAGTEPPQELTATLTTGDLEIGAVEMKNATDDTRALVGVASAIAEGNNALAVQAPVLGVTTGAAVVTDAAGTLQQYLRGLVTLFIAEDFATQTTLASILATAGATTGAAVTTDAVGTLQQYLRGLVTLFAAEDFATQTSLAAVLATVGATDGAAVETDAAGTLQQYLRGLVKLFAAEDFATQTTLASVLATAGATTGAAVTTDAAGTLQQYLRGLVTLFAAEDFATQTTLAAMSAKLPAALGPTASPSALAVTETTCVANAPIDAAGKAVADNLTCRIDGTADLVAGAKYLVEVWPDIAAGAAASDIIWGWIKSATTVGSQGDGKRIATGLSRIIIPVAGKLNLSFMRDSNTAFACRVYVHRLDA